MPNSLDPTSMAMGWLVGRAIAGRRKKQKQVPDGVLISSDGYILKDSRGRYLCPKKQLVAYLYNGARLPILPVEADEYPYLCIYKDADEDRYWLWGSKSPIYIDTGNYGDKVNSTKPCITANYAPETDASWSDITYNLYLGGQLLDYYTFVWCNDQIKKGETVVHEATDPIPVYE